MADHPRSTHAPTPKVDDPIIPFKSHGLPGEVLVTGNENYYCVQCGGLLVASTVRRTTIHCVNRECDHCEWELLRPDLYNCKVLGKPGGSV
jgi:hypothetical protein